MRIKTKHIIFDCDIKTFSVSLSVSSPLLSFPPVFPSPLVADFSKRPGRVSLTPDLSDRFSCYLC